jgi:1-deoxy-D-xylulose-5-phosphate synthase
VLPIGKAQPRREGRRVAILAFGPLLKTALEAGEELDATVVNMRFVKPLDEELVVRLARSHELLVTLEDNVVMGGAGSAVAECLAAHDLPARLLQLGLPDRFVDHGDQSQLLVQVGLNRAGVVQSIRARLAEAAPPTVVRVA